MKKNHQPNLRYRSLTFVFSIFCLTLLVLLFQNSSILAQASAPTLPTFTEYNVASTTTANPVLNSDLTTFGPNDYRVIGFVNDNAGPTGDDLLLTIVDNPGSYYQLIIKPSDVDNNLVYPPFFTNSISLFAPDIALMNNANGVSAILVFNTWDANSVGWIMQVDFDMTTHMFTFNSGLNQAVNLGGPWGDYAFYPAIDGDHLSNPQRVAVSFLDYSNTAFTSYFEDNGGSFAPMAGGAYSHMPSTVPVATGHYVSDIDVAISRETSNNLPASVVSYIDNDPNNNTAYLKVDFLPASPPGSNPPYSSGLNQFLSNTYLGATTLLPSPIFPRICAQPEFDWATQGIMQWSVVVGSLDGSTSTPPHLFYANTDPSGFISSIYIDNPNSYGQSLNYLPALDWMTDPNTVLGAPTGIQEDAFIAWRGFISINPSGSGTTDGMYGIMTPFLPTAPSPYTDWYQVNKLSMSGVKNSCAVASNPIFNGYVVSWYDQGKIYYKVPSMGSVNFKNPNQLSNFLNSNQNIDVSPNPAITEITFQFPNDKNHYTISNILGVVIEEGYCPEKHIKIDISKYAEGNYILRSGSSSSKFTIKH